MRETALLVGGREGQREEGSKHPHASVSTALMVHPGGTEFHICNSFHDNMSLLLYLDYRLLGAGKTL